MSKYIHKCGIGAFFLCLFSILTVTSASAANNWAYCVQEQLLDAGFDPNGVDGAIGGGTRAAASDWAAANESSLPALSGATAEEWCHALVGEEAAFRLTISGTGVPETRVTMASMHAGEKIEELLRGFAFTPDEDGVYHATTPHGADVYRATAICLGTELPSGEWQTVAESTGERSGRNAGVCQFDIDGYFLQTNELYQGYSDGAFNFNLEIVAK